MLELPPAFGLEEEEVGFWSCICWLKGGSVGREGRSGSVVRWTRRRGEETGEGRRKGDDEGTREDRQDA